MKSFTGVLPAAKSCATAFSVALATAIAMVGSVPAQTAAPAGNAAAGETAFALCSACHQIGMGAANAVGPVLNGIIGRKAGTYPGFEYSDANKKSGIVWDATTLAAYLPDPEKAIPGTAMTIGLSEAKDVADVIAYIRQFDAQGNKAAAK